MNSERTTLFYDMLKRFLLKYRILIISDFLVTTIYLSIILFYSKGSLFISGDNPGMYSIAEFLRQYSIYQIFFPISFWLANGNVYVASYIQTFLNMYFLLLSLSFLCIEFFSGIYQKKYMIGISIIVPFIFLNNLSLINVGWQTFLGTLSVPFAFFILFLIFAVRISNKIIDGRSISLLDMLFTGAFLGVATEIPYPNFIRWTTMGLVIFLYFVLFSAIYARGVEGRKILLKSRLKPVLISVMVLILSIFVFDIGNFLELLFNYHFYISTSANLATVYNQLSSSPSFLNFWNVIRGIYNGFFGATHYHTIYLNNKFFIFATLLWPVIVFLISPTIAYIKSRSKGVLGNNSDSIMREGLMYKRLFYRIIMVNIMILLMVIWDSSTNPPFQILKLARQNHLIGIIYQLFPPGMFSTYVVPEFYTIIVAFAIAELFFGINSQKKNGSTSKIESRETWKRQKHLLSRPITVTIALLLIIIIVLAALPIYNGQIESNYWNTNSSGVWIPDSYFRVRDLMSAYGGNVLLLPAVNSYIMTSWNYFGTSGFYNNFFYTNNIIDITNMGKGVYSAMNESLVQQYLELASPIGPSSTVEYPIIVNNPPSLPLSATYDNYGVWGANSTRNGSSIIINSTYSSYVHVGFVLKNTISLSSYPYVRILLNFSDLGFIRNATESGYSSVGIGSPSGIIAWWNLESLLPNYNGNQVSFYVPLEQGYSGAYNGSDINQIWFVLNFPEKESVPAMNVSLPQLYGVPYTINQNWLNLMKYDNIRLILLDNSITGGLMLTYNYTYSAVGLLLKFGIIEGVYKSGPLYLFKIIKY